MTAFAWTRRSSRHSASTDQRVATSSRYSDARRPTAIPSRSSQNGSSRVGWAERSRRAAYRRTGISRIRKAAEYRFDILPTGRRVGQRPRRAVHTVDRSLRPRDHRGVRLLGSGVLWPRDAGWRVQQASEAPHAHGHVAATDADELALHQVEPRVTHGSRRRRTCFHKILAPDERARHQREAKHVERFRSHSRVVREQPKSIRSWHGVGGRLAFSSPSCGVRTSPAEFGGGTEVRPCS